MAEIEGPEEINPDHLAVGRRAELLLKDPSVAQVNEDGTYTELVPEARWLNWSEVPLVADPSNCEHAFSVCYECADSWGIDYYVQFLVEVEGEWNIIWRSPDHPDGPIDNIEGEN